MLGSHGAPGSASSEHSDDKNESSCSSPDASRAWHFLSCLTGPGSMHGDTMFLPELTSEAEMAPA